jgi:1,4-alpha-glucan branching enzyme
MHTSVDPEALRLLIDGANSAPFDLLGPHPAEEGTVSIRVFRPDAQAVALTLPGTEITYEMARLHESGFFEVTIPGRPDMPYQLILFQADGSQVALYDPYRYGPWLSNAELYHFGEGRFWHSYEKFGAQLTVIEGVPGVAFAVWAPQAVRVSVIGDFNGWDDRLHPMRRRPGNGVWELFIPGMGEGELYQYSLLTTDGDILEKTDPYGFWTELRPGTASITASMWYTWGDQQWMDHRPARHQEHDRLSIYQVHPGTWMRGPEGDWLDYQEMGQRLVDYCLSMGYTHLALTPLAEYPEDESLGYVSSGFYAITSRYGSPLDFMRFVDYSHQNNIGVLLDWCPAQFAPGEPGLEAFDGSPIYEHPDPVQARHPLWGTLGFNYASPEVRNYLFSSALFWLDMYHIDGLRLDRVSAMLYRDHGRSPGQWVMAADGGNIHQDAVHFLRLLNDVIDDAVPGVLMIADEATGWPGVTAPSQEGGLGFDLMWQTRWAREVIEYFSGDAHGRRYHHQRLVSAITPGERAVLALSHKDVQLADGALINRLAGDEWQQRATLRLMLGLQMTMPGRKWVFMGTEFGARQPWDDSTPLDWSLVQEAAHSTLQYWVFDLHRLQVEHPALTDRDFNPAGFRWIESNDAANGVYSFARLGNSPADFLVMVAHVQPIVREGYRIGVPAGDYDEILNSDSVYYGGSNIGNGAGHRQTEAQPWQGQPASLVITLPPLSLLVFKPTGAVSLPEPLVEAEAGIPAAVAVPAVSGLAPDDDSVEQAAPVAAELEEAMDMPRFETPAAAETEAPTVAEVASEDTQPDREFMSAAIYIGPPPDALLDTEAEPVAEPLSQDAIETEEMPRIRLHLPEGAEAVMGAAPAAWAADSAAVALPSMTVGAEPLAEPLEEAPSLILVDAEPGEHPPADDLHLIDAHPDYADAYQEDEDGYIVLPLYQSELPTPYFIGEATVVAVSNPLALMVDDDEFADDDDDVEDDDEFEDDDDFDDDEDDDNEFEDDDDFDEDEDDENDDDNDDEVVEAEDDEAIQYVNDEDSADAFAADLPDAYDRGELGR